MNNSISHVKRDAGAGASKGRRKWVSLGVLLAAALGFLVVSVLARRAPGVASNLFAQQQRQITSTEGKDYSKFLHADHRDLSCESCHRRGDNSPNPPRLPGHDSCTNCHRAQFTVQVVPMCQICHTDGMNNNDVKSFPLTLQKSGESFNAMFDHAQHLRGAATPRNGCAACHGPQRRGVAIAIPARLEAHATCYQCHSPGSQDFSGRDMSTCGVCHERARYSRTSTNSRAYSLSFSHADHGPRQRLNCASCHEVKGSGLPQSRQMSETVPAQHFANPRPQSCFTCHNGKRSFGGDNFGDCKRCHKGQTFRLPA